MLLMLGGRTERERGWGWREGKFFLLWREGMGEANGISGPGMVYAFDIVERGGAPFLANQRVFAYLPGGRPMGILCDEKGNVFVCCKDGVEVFGKGGSLLGVIEVPGM